MTDSRQDAWAIALADGSFEEARTALEEVVAHLEHGQLSLAESVECYEVGVRLADRCDRLLAAAALRIGEIDASAFGAAEEPPGQPDSASEPMDLFSLDDVPF